MIELTLTWTGRVESTDEARNLWKLLRRATDDLPITPRTELAILLEEDTDA
jgi:hypothetical protein